MNRKAPDEANIGSEAKPPEGFTHRGIRLGELSPSGFLLGEPCPRLGGAGAGEGESSKQWGFKFLDANRFLTAYCLLLTANRGDL